LKNNNGTFTKKSGFFSELIKNKVLFLMLLPATIFVIVFSYVPMAGIIVAFKNYNYVQGIYGSPWFGFKNFELLFSSGKILSLTQNTLSYNLTFMVLNTLLEIVLAVLFAELAGRVFKKTLQSITLLPYFISWVIVGGFAYSIFNYEYGSLNTLLTYIGLPKVNVYQNPQMWRFILPLFSAWKIVGYGTVIYLASIMGINEELYEAAYLDGAGLMKRIRLITLPLLIPTIITMTLLKLGGVLRGNFEMFYQLVGTNGLLFSTTDVIDTYVYRALIEQRDIGVSSAIGLYQQFFGFVLVIIVNFVIKKIDSENALF
jgi:putative aldouronate transport system permease protein